MKVIKLRESDIQRMVKRVLNEEDTYYSRNIIDYDKVLRDMKFKFAWGDLSSQWLEEFEDDMGDIIEVLSTNEYTDLFSDWMEAKSIGDQFNRVIKEDWKDTSWEDDDGKITIGDIVDYIGDNVRNISVSDLQNKLRSQLDKVEKDKERIMKADLQYPIILVQKDGEFSYVLDGNHRLQKAIMTGEEYIKAKVLYLDDKNTPEEFKRLLENQKG